MTEIDTTKCMSRRNKGSGWSEQCPYNRKIGEYCGRHAKVKHVNRIDIEENQPASPGKTTKNKKTTVTWDCYTPVEFQNTPSTEIEYRRLVRTMRHYRISLHPERKQCVHRLRSFFTNSWIPPQFSTGQINLTQLREENPELWKRLVSLAGPGTADRMECDNPMDFYDLTPLEEIPSVYFFSFQDKQRIYGMDFRSLHKMIQTQEKSLLNLDMNKPDKRSYVLQNPYNREPIPDEAIKRFIQLRWLLHQNRIPVEYPEEVLTPEEELKFQILDTFQIIYRVGEYPVEHTWFTTLNQKKLFTFYLRLEDIWNYRLQLTDKDKEAIIPREKIGSTFCSAEMNEFEHLSNQTLSTKEFHDFQSRIHGIIRKMISSGATKADCINGMIYVLTALVDVSNEAANALFMIVQSF